MRSVSPSSCSMSLSRSVSLGRVSKSPSKYNSRNKSGSRRRNSVSRHRSSYSRDYSSKSTSRWSSTYSRSSSRPRSRYRDRYSSDSSFKSYSASRSGSRSRSRSVSSSYSSSVDSRRYRRDSRTRHKRRDYKYSKSPVTRKSSRSRDDYRRNGRDAPKRSQQWSHASNNNYQHRRIPSKYDIDKRHGQPSRDNKYTFRVKLNGANSIPIREAARPVREYKDNKAHDYKNEKRLDASKGRNGTFPRLDRSTMTPFLLRVYVNVKSGQDDMQLDGDVDVDVDGGTGDSSDELQIYLWANSNLRDLVNLIKDTCPRSRLSSGLWVFKRVVDGKILDDFAQIHAYIPSRDDFTKICHLEHVIGDALHLTYD